MNDLSQGRGIYVCSTCGHEWPIEEEEAATGGHSEDLVVKDANGNLLVTGDSVVLIKDLKLKGSSTTIKGGTKIKNIKLVSGDHEIDCKADGMSLMLKACFVRKA
jgi:protein PhnA